MVLVVFGHRRVLMSVSWRWRDLAGIGHFIIFWGFISKLVGYTLFLILDPIKPTNSAFVLSPTGLEVFFWWLDILTVLVLASVIWAAVRRWIGRPKRLEGLQGYEPGIILMATGSLMLFHQLTQISIVAAAEANPAAVAYLGGAVRRRLPPGPRFREASGRRWDRRASPPRRRRRCTHLLLGALPHHRELLRLHPDVQALPHHRLAAERLLPQADRTRGAAAHPQHGGGRGLGRQAPSRVHLEGARRRLRLRRLRTLHLQLPRQHQRKRSRRWTSSKGSSTTCEVAPAVAKATAAEEREQASDAQPLLGRHFTEEWVWTASPAGPACRSAPSSSITSTASSTSGATW